jgi:hypothetical protein
LQTQTIEHALRGEDIAADEHGEDSPQHEAARKRTEYVAKLADFDESKHPRADDGKFGSGGGGSDDDEGRLPQSEIDKQKTTYSNPHAEKYNPSASVVKAGGKWGFTQIDGKQSKKTFGTKGEAQAAAYDHKKKNADSDIEAPSEPEKKEGYDPESSVVKYGDKWTYKTSEGNDGKILRDSRAEALNDAKAHKDFLDGAKKEPASPSETGGERKEKSVQEKPSTKEEWGIAVDEIDRAHAKKVWSEMNRRWDSGDNVQFNTMTRATNAEAKHRDLFRQIGREIQMRQGKGWVSLKGQAMDTMAINMGINPRLDYPDLPDETPTGHEDGWETLAEYSGDDPDFKEAREKYHREMVEDAIKSGHDVPKRVLADYPDLVPAK